jgi:predicted metal-dependent phosphoesterase TrpH
VNKFDLHMHTYYSFDSLIQPKQLIKSALNLDYRVIAVTDHNTIRGALATKEKARGENLVVIVGAEIYTDCGDIIGLFLSEEIKSREFKHVVQEIQDQNGLVYLPHPYASHTKLEKIDLKSIDVIEARNGRKPEWQNQLSVKLAKELDKPGVGGSDTHILFEFGGVYNQTGEYLETEESIRKVILSKRTEILRMRVKKPFLPVTRATYYMSWMRTGNYGKFITRGNSALRRIICKYAN